MIKKCILILFVGVTTYAQENNELKLSFSGFLETYYAYDFNQPKAQAKLPFMYNYNRHNEFNLNIGLLRAKAEYDNGYAVLSIHSGSYVEDNYANETTKIINEAYLGLFFDKAKKSTLEMGILPSYIGFETANNASNLTLTRSMLADNSPYFMTGVKYSYALNEKWTFSGLVTNGWQRINKPNKNIGLSFGSQISYKPSTYSVFNWSTFMGKELYNEQWGMRYFSNLYWDNKWNSKWRTIVGFDAGMQLDKSQNSNQLFWMSPVFIMQYSLSSQWQTAFRAEYYQDKHNVIVAVGEKFNTLGTSFNIDYQINSKVKFRTETRYLNSQESIFLKDEIPVSGTFFITSSLSFEF